MLREISVIVGIFGLVMLGGCSGDDSRRDSGESTPIAAQGTDAGGGCAQVANNCGSDYAYAVVCPGTASPVQCVNPMVINKTCTATGCSAYEYCCQ